MRRSKYAGLSERAKQVVASATKVENVGNLSAVFHSLKRYTMPDGTVYTEYLQDISQSISDVYFTSLHDQNGVKPAELLWRESEMRTW